MLLSMLAGHDRLKRLFAVAPGAESEAARTARIVDSFLRASSTMKFLVVLLVLPCSPPAPTAARRQQEKKAAKDAAPRRCR